MNQWCRSGAIYSTTSNASASTFTPTWWSSYERQKRKLICDICGEEVDSDDMISIDIYKDDEIEVLYMHKQCFLTEPEAVEALITFSDLVGF